ncbi:MAG: potassium channel family protein [Actinomycetota bacterium]
MTDHPARVAARGGITGLITRVRGEDSYALVLLMTVLTIAFLAGTSDQGWEWIVGISLLCITLLVALHTSNVHRRTFRLALVLCVFALLGAAAGSTSEGTVATTGLAVIGAVLVFVTPIAMLRRVTQHLTINGQTVFAGITVYLLVGLFFSFVFMVIARADPQPFFEATSTGAASDGGTSDYLFFSYVTMTTLGYGNLVPEQDLPRMLAVLEALLGQIYLVTVVAMIVAGFATTAQERRSERSEERDRR